MAIDSSRARTGGRSARTARETVPELEQFCRRLRANGADDEEVAAVVRTWDDFDDEYGPLQRAQMVRWSDTRIRAELRALRDEYEVHTG